MTKRFSLILDSSSSQHSILFDHEKTSISPDKKGILNPPRLEFSVENLSDRWDAFNFGSGRFGINKNGTRVVDGRNQYGQLTKYGKTRVVSTVALTLHGIPAVHEDIARNGNSLLCPHQYSIRIAENKKERLCIMQFTKDHNVIGIIKEKLPYGIHQFELIAICLILRTGVLNFSD